MTGVTCRLAVPATPFGAVAVSVVSPAATPTARPDAFTVATAGLLLLHVYAMPTTGKPSWSIEDAENARLAPTLMDALGGETLTMTASCAAAVIDRNNAHAAKSKRPRLPVLISPSLLSDL